jgi:hypothetical protein
MSGYSFVLFLHVLSGIELFVGRPLEGTILARIWSALLADLPRNIAFLVAVALLFELRAWGHGRRVST